MEITRDEAVERGLQAGTMLDRVQLEYLYDLAEKAPDGPAAEVGVWKGGSLLAWSVVRVGRGSLIAVDNWSSGGGRPELEDIFLFNLKSYGVEALVMNCNSWEAPSKLVIPLSFVFIDADHGIRGIPRDLLVWPDLIMPGGILAFHDYDVWKPTVVVKAVVDAWQAEVKWEDLGLVGSVKAYQKPLG